MQSSFIKQSARSCGFTLCGIAKNIPLSIEKERFEQALAQDYHAKKAYLERDIDKRFHPALFLENCKSVIVCGFNYNMGIGTGCALKPNEDNFKISRYAQIKDYHVFMKEKLEMLAQYLKEKYGNMDYKTTADSSSISEKAWAVQAGVGYYGKNGIIQTQFGSFVFLGILLIDKEVDEYDTPHKKSCGNCGKCMAACPTQAIVAPYCVDSNRCISNINLNKNETDFSSIVQYGWLAGCDICQEVCPNNIHAPVNAEAVALRASFLENKNEILESLTQESFEHYFKETAFYKFKYEGMKKRLNALR